MSLHNLIRSLSKHSTLVLQLCICYNDELSLSSTWLDCLHLDSEDFILLAESNQIFLKISFILILLTFMYVSSM